MSMSLRIDASELIAGALVIGDTGLGVRGDAVPSVGDAGPAPLYNDITLPADAAAEVRALILTLPSAGTLTVNEDSSFTFAGAPDGVYTWTYRAFKDGVSLGDNTVTLTVGAIGLAGLAADIATATGSLTTHIPLAGAAIDQALATGTLTTQIQLSGTALDQAGATGTLTVGIAGLGGDALAQAIATGSLSTGIRLTGAALDVVSASGDLYSVPVPLAGSAVSISVASGTLTVQIRLAGTATARATATGTLAGAGLIQNGRYIARNDQAPLVAQGSPRTFTATH